MVYHGRIVVAGLTPSRNPFAAYAISGRSEGSKKRWFLNLFDSVVVQPVGGELTAEQEKSSHLIFYNAMRKRKDALLFTTNGAQTDTNYIDDKKIMNFYDDFETRGDATNILEEWGYENDPPIFTPRIALVSFPYDRALFSIVTKSGVLKTASSKTKMLSHDSAVALSTYQAKDDNALPWSFESPSDIEKCLINVPLNGESPEEIADQLYNFLDNRFVVSTAGAVFDVEKQKWNIAVKNSYRTEEEFRAYMERQK